MKVVKWYKEAVLVRYFGMVDSSLICLTVLKWLVFVFVFSGKECSMYNGIMRQIAGCT